MELKLSKPKGWFLQVSAFNRTFMELKQDKATLYEKYVAAFNRTFMELKHEMKPLLKEGKQELLIAPLWN